MSDKLHALRVSSPFQGWCTSLDDSPDAVFSSRTLGEGVSIDPTSGEVHAPFDGEVLTVPDSRHAINLRANNGAEFLIHVGIDSVNMAGHGFEAHVSRGDQVKRGQLLLSFDLEQVLRGSSSLKSPVLMLDSDEHEVFNLRQTGPVLFGEHLFEIKIAREKSAFAEVPDRRKEASKVIVVGLEHGIHARPAAALINAIKDLEVSVLIHLDERHRADARSAVALMSLGVSYNDIVTLKAVGKDADIAIEAMTALLEPLAHHPEQLTSTPEPVATEPTAIKTEPPIDGTVIRAQAASTGLGIGCAFTLGSWEGALRTAAGSTEDESLALSEAMYEVRVLLQTLADSRRGTAAEIAEAHLALLEDPMIMTTARQQVTNGSTAGVAWHKAIDNAIATLAVADNPRMRERTDDLRDINLRVQRVLAGQDLETSAKIPSDSVVIADNLLPSQLLELDRNQVSGICLASGGVTSHVAILAISMNIPMLVAAGPALLSIEDGSTLLVDTEFGELQINPDKAVTSSFESRIKTDKARHERELSTARDKCITQDGTHIHIYANLESAEDAIAAVEAGAEGCGLLRTEFAFMGKARAPELEEQLEVYQRISTALGSRPMVARILDAGGDKPIGYLDQPFEGNPALGIRGIRLGLNNLRLLETQLGAFLQLKHSQPLQIMIPMVSSVHEVYAVRDILKKLDPKGENTARIRLGVMIETPAAALIADRLAQIVDFFSIGTNDLTQYTLCMDRGEPQLAARLDTLHPAVLNLIKHTADAARQANIPVAVCGAAAGDLLISPILLGLGIQELSMPKSLIARQKACLRSLSMEACVQAANDCLAMDSAREVRAHMRKLMNPE